MEVLLPVWNRIYKAAIAVVQHRSRESDGAFARPPRRYSSLPLEEAETNNPSFRAACYLAPPNYHLLVDGGSFALDTEDRVCHARPSIDVLFRMPPSPARASLGRGRDRRQSRRSAGARHIKERGGILVVQDPQTAENGVMPAAALALTTADQVLSLADIAPFINRCAAAARANQNATAPLKNI